MLKGYFYSAFENQLPYFHSVRMQKQYLKNDSVNSKLGLNWHLIQNPNTALWSLITKKDGVEINIRQWTAKEKANPSYICFKQEHVKFEVLNNCSLNFQNIFEEAVLRLLREIIGIVKFNLMKERKPHVYKASIFGNGLACDYVIFEIPSKTNIFTIKMQINHDKFNFECSTDSENTLKISSSKFVSENTYYFYHERSAGTTTRMYSSSNGHPTRVKAYFNCFTVS